MTIETLLTRCYICSKRTKCFAYSRTSHSDALYFNMCGPCMSEALSALRAASTPKLKCNRCPCEIQVNQGVEQYGNQFICVHCIDYRDCPKMPPRRKESAFITGDLIGASTTSYKVPFTTSVVVTGSSLNELLTNYEHYYQNPYLKPRCLPCQDNAHCGQCGLECCGN